MKRKLADTESERGPCRRQPQVSCDFCRRKKLKCDRGAPCTNCSVRGLSCGGQTTIQPVREFSEQVRESEPKLGGSNGPSVLARIKRLEDAIFGVETPAPAGKIDGESGVFEGLAQDGRFPQISASRGTRPSLATDMDRQQKARSLDFTFTKNDHRLPLHRDSVKYQITGTPSSSGTSQYPQPLSDRRPYTTSLPINLMAREDALIFLNDFVDNPLHLLPIIHEPTVRSMIGKLYDDLSRPRGTSPHPAHAALVFSLAATCASFYYDGCNIAHMFHGEDEAGEATLAWVHSALGLLDQSQRATSYCLEDIQARVIIAYVFYNTEGCSARFRFLHSSSLSMARDLGLHLIDGSKNNQSDDRVTKEIKRRLWWYIVSTDWMLGFMGGPLDGTYSVQPRHMKVRYVRNINDRDLETQDENFEYLDHVPTDMSFLIHRTRLAEICRLALDARTPGAPDEDLLDIESAIYLDGLFDKILGQLPPFFQPGAEIPHDGPRCLELQRDTIMLAIHSRWARMHRRYLLSNHKDPRSRPLRERCLKSARISVSVATKMLDPSHVRLGWAQSAQPIPVTHRMGVVVGHLFMGCTMLALIAGPNPGTAGNGDGTDALEIQEELRQACRALTQSGRNSPIAATLVRDLTGVVRQYSGQGVTDGVESHTSQDGDRPLSVLPEAAPEVDPGMVMMPGVMGMDETLLDGGGLEQNGLWTDLLNTMTSTEAWDELFTGLDSYCGTT